MPGRNMREYMDFSNWSAAIRNHPRHCKDAKRTVRADDNAIVDVHAADNSLLGFWDCETDCGEVCIS